MKKINIAFGITVALLASGVAQASETGEVRFNGLVIAQSCAINADTGQTVRLPTTNINALSTEKSEMAGVTAFNITATDCPLLEGPLPKLVWEHTNSNINEDGYLKNENGSAKNVVLAISSNKEVINLSDPDNQTAGSTATNSNGKANITYSFEVGYLKDASVAENATAGSIETSLTYRVTYL